MCFSEQIFYRKQSLDAPVRHCRFFFCFLAAWVSIKTFKQSDKTVTINRETEHQEKTFSYLCSCSAITLNNSQEHAGLKKPNCLSLKIWRIRLQSILKKDSFHY